MTKIDTSNVIPKAARKMFARILPDLLFELGVTFCDPNIAHLMIGHAKQIESRNHLNATEKQ